MRHPTDIRLERPPATRYDAVSDRSPTATIVVTALLSSTVPVEENLRNALVEDEQYT